MLDTSDMDPELARYLNRNYWEQKRDDQKTGTSTAPSAPTASSEAKSQANKTSEVGMKMRKVQKFNIDKN